jgi:hypothetical protein
MFKEGRTKICALLGHYAASIGNPLPTFRDNVSVPYSSVKKSNDWAEFLTLEHGTDKLSVNAYHSTLRNTPEEHRSHLQRGGKLEITDSEELIGTTDYLRQRTMCRLNPLKTKRICFI